MNYLQASQQHVNLATMETETFFSTVKPDFKNHLLKRGSLIALIGSIPMIYAGTMVTPDKLQYIGLPLFLVWIASITIGMLPYRRLCRLEEAPHRITVSGDAIHFYIQGKQQQVVKIQDIQKLEYREEGVYGIEVSLKGGEVLFFPYFSQRTWRALLPYLE